ncbi:unnamed protein product [Leuciscus chuanchicus]
MDKSRSCQRSWRFEPSQRGADPPVCCRGMAAAVEDLSTDWLNERTLSTADTGSESKKAGQRVKHHLAHSRTASASIL